VSSASTDAEYQTVPDVESSRLETIDQDGFESAPQLVTVANDSATQDMLALNIDLASVMQAGRWKTTAMPMRYGENVQAGIGGMARTAKAQGRAK
jgi:hypothetical protein